jgi:hypothetical protein
MNFFLLCAVGSNVTGCVVRKTTLFARFVTVTAVLMEIQSSGTISDVD